MQFQSKPSLITSELGENFSSSKIFLAEKIIVRYLGKIPESWDDTLSLATILVYQRLDMDAGIKSESTDGHSVHYADMSDLKNLLGASVLAILDAYRDQPTDSDSTGFYGFL